MGEKNTSVTIDSRPRMKKTKGPAIGRSMINPVLMAKSNFLNCAQVYSILLIVAIENVSQLGENIYFVLLICNRSSKTPNLCPVVDLFARNNLLVS